MHTLWTANIGHDKCCWQIPITVPDFEHELPTTQSSTPEQELQLKIKERQVCGLTAECRARAVSRVRTKMIVCPSFSHWGKIISLRTLTLSSGLGQYCKHQMPKLCQITSKVPVDQTFLENASIIKTNESTEEHNRVVQTRTQNRVLQQGNHALVHPSKKLPEVQRRTSHQMMEWTWMDSEKKWV